MAICDQLALVVFLELAILTGLGTSVVLLKRLSREIQELSDAYAESEVHRATLGLDLEMAELEAAYESFWRTANELMNAYGLYFGLGGTVGTKSSRLARVRSGLTEVRERYESCRESARIISNGKRSEAESFSGVAHKLSKARISVVREKERMRAELNRVMARIEALKEQR